MTAPSSTRPAFAVIGAGIIGVAVARELIERFPNALVTVFEKSSDVAAHQGGHNSGVVHSGLYYEPGSLKARLCRRGVELLEGYTKSRDLPYKACGKLVVALHADEHDRLTKIYERAVANGVPNVELINAKRLALIEPNATGTLALYSPHTAITDYAAITRSLADDVRATGGVLRFETEVVGIANLEHGCQVVTQTNGSMPQSQTFDYVIACAGLQSDRVAQLAGGAAYPKIVPFFGQYARLEPKHRDILNGLVYPVPDPAYPFLGVHLTKRVDGEMLIGPNAFLSLGRENYSGRQLNVADVTDVVTNPGFWKFAARNIKTGLKEFTGVMSQARFRAGATAYVPKLLGAASTPITRGIRAQAMDKTGRLVDDFVIETLGRATFLRNAPSPGATSSLAIAEYMVDQIAMTHGLTGRETGY